jgi:hypothetical protein
MAVTILFGGSIGDALATLAIGLAIQPAPQRIERSQLTAFFQVVFGVSATALLVLLGAAIAGAASLSWPSGPAWTCSCRSPAPESSCWMALAGIPAESPSAKRDRLLWVRPVAR